MTSRSRLLPDVHRERVLLVGGGRALIMQLAHPLVATAVAEHSDFPAAALRRLRRTLDLSLAMTFGPPEKADRATAQIRSVHEQVRGVSGDGVAYRADDPRLLLWVYATLIDTTLLCYERFVRPLKEPDRRRYYLEAVEAGPLLGIPASELPSDLDAFRGYFRETLDGPELRATSEGRTLVRSVLRPPVALPLRPAFEIARIFTLALLPERIRELFGLRATLVARLALGTTESVSRRILPLLPDALRTFRRAREVSLRAGAGREYGP